MRWALAALVVMIAGVAVAQPAWRYDLYILDTGDGREIYAVSAGAGRAAALEVRGCGDVSLIGEAADMVRELRARRRHGDENVIVVHGRNSRTELGPCGAEDASEDEDENSSVEDSTSLVIIENLSPAQTRNTLRTLDAAPVAIRERMIADLGL